MRRLVLIAALSALGSTVVGCSTGSGAAPTPAEPAATTQAPARAPSSAPASAEPPRFVAAVDREQLEADITFVAKPRPPGSDHHRVVREACAERLKAHGFEVTRQPFATGENVIGVRPGKSERQVILSAHYDSVASCSGADDNATGVAVVWEAARLLGKGSFPLTLVLACWDDEEAGLRGSAAYASRARSDGDDIALAISLDGVGYANHAEGSQKTPPGFERMFPVMGKQLAANGHRANFIAAIADTAAEPGLTAFAAQASSVGLPLLGDALGVLQRLALLDAARSDHASFWLKGYPAMLVTDTANFRSPYYHCRLGDDAVATLDMAFTAKVARVVVGATADLLQSSEPTSAANPTE